MKEFTQCLVPFLDQSLKNLRQRLDTVLPDLHQAPADWFQFWDEVSSGRPDDIAATCTMIAVFRRATSWRVA